MSEILAKIVFLIAVVDPIGSVPVFLEATKDFNRAQRKKIAVRSSFIAFCILVGFILVGQVILENMHVTLDAFRISGGLILFLFSLTMIFGESKPESEKGLITDYRHVTVFPIAIPSIASPGAIMAVVILTDNSAHGVWDQLLTTGLLFLVITITATLLLLASMVQRRIGDYGIIIISKVMGLILASYATQNILVGLREFFSIGG